MARGKSGNIYSVFFERSRSANTNTTACRSRKTISDGSPCRLCRNPSSEIVFRNRLPKPMSDERARTERDRERDRAPLETRRPGHSASSHIGRQPRNTGDNPPGWMGLEKLRIAGLSSTTVFHIEAWLQSINVDAFVAGFTSGTTSKIVRFRGECYFCRKHHRNNHWVLLQSPGYDSSRLRCHKTGKTASGPLFELL